MTHHMHSEHSVNMTTISAIHDMKPWVTTLSFCLTVLGKYFIHPYSMTFIAFWLSHFHSPSVAKTLRPLYTTPSLRGPRQESYPQKFHHVSAHLSQQFPQISSNNVISIMSRFSSGLIPKPWNRSFWLRYAIAKKVVGYNGGRRSGRHLEN